MGRKYMDWEQEESECSVHHHWDACLLREHCLEEWEESAQETQTWHLSYSTLNSLQNWTP